MTVHLLHCPTFNNQLECNKVEREREECGEGRLTCTLHTNAWRSLSPFQPARAYTKPNMPKHNGARGERKVYSFVVGDFSLWARKCTIGWMGNYNNNSDWGRRVWTINSIGHHTRQKRKTKKESWNWAKCSWEPERVKRVSTSLFYVTHWPKFNSGAARAQAEGTENESGFSG